MRTPSTSGTVPALSREEGTAVPSSLNPIPYNPRLAESAARQLSGYTRQTLGRFMGIKSSMICRALGGTRMPSTETLARLNSHTGIAMEELFSYFLMRRAEKLSGSLQ